MLLLFTSSLTLVLHSLGLAAYLYWKFWWFDIVTHALGGFSLGLLIAFLVPKKHIFLMYGALILCIIGWEIFEIVFAGIETGTMSYVIDIISDLAIGFAAAHGAIWIYHTNTTERKHR